MTATETEAEGRSSVEEIHGPRQLSPGVSQFVESMGMLMERYGISRIGGRIMGLFMLDTELLSLDDIARLLGVSRASVSTNLRMTEMSGLAKRVARPGDRRDYYVGTEDLWMQSIRSSKQDSIEQMAKAARAALPNVPPDDQVARRHLQEIIDFAEFFSARLDQILEEWPVYKARKVAERNIQNSPE
jgi:DNA-binding transcriptional regulator GbsR (MarR family)